MSPEYARCVDDATVALLEQTSWQDPRDYLADCASCRRPFWVHAHGARYCGRSCQSAADYRRRRPYLLAWHAAYRAARRAA